jgi:hypothetical protein
MPKWKKGAKEFIVGINFYDKRGYQSSIPKPIIEAMGKPNKIKFILKGEKVELVKVKKDDDMK